MTMVGAIAPPSPWRRWWLWAWLVAVAVVAATSVWFPVDLQMFALVFGIVAVPVAAALAAIPMLLLWRTVTSLFARRPGAALAHLTALIAGIGAAIAGPWLVDRAVVAWRGPALVTAVAAVTAGRPAPPGIVASSRLAVERLRGYMESERGIAYDPSGRLGELIGRRPALRPADWRVGAVGGLTCVGEARRLGGDFWLVTVLGRCPGGIDGRSREAEG